MKLSVNRSDLAEPLFVFYLLYKPRTAEAPRFREVQFRLELHAHQILGILRALPVQLPPLAQQQAIAAVLSDVDELIGWLWKR